VISQSKDILERVERVLEYHRVSKHTPASIVTLKPQTDPSAQPSPYRSFPGLPKVSLPTGLLDLAVSAQAVMREGLAALPESHVRPPQDLKTIATWLYFAYGITAERNFEGHKYRLRTCPSGSALFPCELYLAAFAIEGLEPGLYSFNPREFTLTKLRDGPETLAHLKRGRPDLAFLRFVPAALLVSTIFWRTAWKYRVRGFRVALEDAGHLIANVVATANGLGIATMTRLKMNDNTMRELIGIPHNSDFGAFEAVQAMVVWADNATSPIDPSPPGVPPQTLPPIPREPLSADVVPYGSIVAAHQDCVAPGIPLRDVKPPFTELRAHQNSDQQDRRHEEHRAADDRYDHQGTHWGNEGIAVVEDGDATRLPHQPGDVPWDGGDHHAPEPEPELPARECLGPQRPPGDARPHLVGDREIHDHDGAPKD